MTRDKEWEVAVANACAEMIALAAGKDIVSLMTMVDMVAASLINAALDGDKEAVEHAAEIHKDHIIKYREMVLAKREAKNG